MWKRIEVVITASTRNRVIQRWVRGFESHRFRQLSPHVLIQSMRTSFCIYRLEIRHNTGYNYQIWAIGAGNELSGVILPDGGFHTLALFSLLMTAFAGRNQRFIMECTLLWTIAGYRPQCEVSSTVSQNSVGSNPCGESMCLRYCFDRKMPGGFSARFSVRRVSFCPADSCALAVIL